MASGAAGDIQPADDKFFSYFLVRHKEFDTSRKS